MNKKQLLAHVPIRSHSRLFFLSSSSHERRSLYSTTVYWVWFECTRKQHDKKNIRRSIQQPLELFCLNHWDDTSSVVQFSFFLTFFQRYSVKQYMRMRRKKAQKIRMAKNEFCWWANYLTIDRFEECIWTLNQLLHERNNSPLSPHDLISHKTCFGKKKWVIFTIRFIDLKISGFITHSNINPRSRRVFLSLSSHLVLFIWIFSKEEQEEKEKRAKNRQQKSKPSEVCYVMVDFSEQKMNLVRSPPNFNYNGSFSFYFSSFCFTQWNPCTLCVCVLALSHIYVASDLDREASQFWFLLF